MKHINRVFKSSGKPETRSVRNKGLRLLMLFMVLMLLLTSCTPKVSPRPSEIVTIVPETPTPSETVVPSEEPLPDDPVPEVKTVVIDGVIYEVAPLPDMPEQTELDFAAEKSKYMESDGRYYVDYVSNVRLVSYTNSNAYEGYIEVTGRTAKKEELQFQFYWDTFNKKVESHMGDIVNILWFFLEGDNYSEDKQVYCYGYDLFVDEFIDDFDTSRLSSYALYTDTTPRTLDGVIKYSEMFDDEFRLISVLGNDGKIYDFYLDDSILYDYKKTVGHEVRMNWIIETLLLGNYESPDNERVFLTVRGVMDIELIGQSAYIEELGKSEEGIPYAPSVVIPDDVDLTIEATAEEMNTDMESHFVSFVKIAEKRTASFDYYDDLTVLDTVDKHGNSLTFAYSHFNDENLEKDAIVCVIWLNKELTDKATGKTDIYKYVIGIEDYSVDTDAFEYVVSTRKLYTSDKIVMEGTFYELAMGDYYYLVFVGEDGFMYAPFIWGMMESSDDLFEIKKGTKIRVAFYEKEMYIWEAGSRILDRQAVEFSVID